MRRPFFVGLGGLSSKLYRFQSVINPHDPAFTQLPGINNSGTIAGYFGGGRIVPNHGFTLVLPNTFTPENFPGAVQTQVIGINATTTPLGSGLMESGLTMASRTLVGRS